MVTLECEHAGRPTGQRATPFGQAQEFACRHPRHNSAITAECAVCQDWMQPPTHLTDHAAETAVLPPLCRHPTGVFVDRYNRDANLADLYKGAHCFLVLGGPSVKQLDLTLLARRGTLIFSGNHWLAGLPQGVRPHIWTSTDPANKFSDSIWYDPGILKLVAVREWNCRRNNLRRRIGETKDFEFIPDARPRDMPGMFGYHRNTTFDPDHWLYEPTINRGNDEKGSIANGWPRVINTFFTVLRIAFYLGIEHLYLLGADFHMDAAQPYSFTVEKSDGAVNSNNNAYASMDFMLGALAPQFETAGFHVWNCNPNSALSVFPFLDYQEAIERATGRFEQTLRTDGWYTKNTIDGNSS